MLNSDLLAQSFIGVDLCGKFPLRINYERQVHFVLSGKFLGESLQVVGRNFRLMLEDVVTKIITEIFSLRVEVSRKHGGVERPIVHG